MLLASPGLVAYFINTWELIGMVTKGNDPIVLGPGSSQSQHSKYLGWLVTDAEALEGVHSGCPRLCLSVQVDVVQPSGPGCHSRAWPWHAGARASRVSLHLQGFSNHLSTPPQLLAIQSLHPGQHVAAGMS